MEYNIVPIIFVENFWNKRIINRNPICKTLGRDVSTSTKIHRRHNQKYLGENYSKIKTLMKIYRWSVKFCFLDSGFSFGPKKSYLCSAAAVHK